MKRMQDTSSYSALCAAQKAWMAVFKNPAAKPSDKAAAMAAYKAAAIKCTKETGII
jgi:hypothetical protein